MNAEVFVDTNVFLYSISDQLEEQAKTERARQLLLNERWAWSVQVAGEFFSTATSPKRPFFRLPIDQAAEYVKTWLEFPTASLTPSTVLRTLEHSSDFTLVIGMPR
jgi:predicted nucleic acid-binding protein